MKSLAMDADDAVKHDDQLVPLKVYIPDLLLQKNFQFHKEDLIWDIKEQILDSLPKELKEQFNYGIFCPPVNGKAGKFLDEHRPLADYPFPDAPGYVELRYKRRVYKMMNLEEKQIKQMHTRANLRRMLEYVNNGQVEKITKMCARGMDPNFHCPETGETPLSTAASLKHPAKVIMGLVNGGALLDYRTKDGQTALHKAVQKNNHEALKTLLDLGASPNYKDSKNLTPLYYTLLHSSDPQLTETLLHDHAFIGTCDPQGWQEVHQACKHGLVQHLEHLLFYGADMNARNASGNTPLHVCAVNDQESCARVLLFRGAEKNALNFANQSPYQVAVIAGNLALADIINNHSDDDVVPYREPPRYNPRRRASVAPAPTLSRTHSDPRLELGLTGMTMMMMMKPPSPCPSNCSLPPFSSVSCISEASSTGSSTTTTTCTTQTSSEDTDASFITEKSATSDSSGVCTSHSGASYEERKPEEGRGPTEDGCALSPGTLCVCTRDYYVGLPGHLRLSVGDSLEVIGETEEEGLLEGRAADGEEGFFPASVVQEADPSLLKPRVEGRREMNARKVTPVPRRWRMFGEPRTVVLHKGKRGFGFVLRGAKATSPLMERQPSEFWPSLQYLDDVDKNGVADQAGLKKGDFLLEINGQDVSQASHEHVVSIIRQSGDLVAMTVITVQGQPSVDGSAAMRQCATLPRKFAAKKAPAPPKRDPRTTLTVGRVRARSMVAGLAEIEALDRTLCDYDSEGRSTKSSSVESIPNKRSAPNVNGKSPKIASIRSRPSSQRISTTELEKFFARQGSTRRPRSYSTLCERKSGDSRTPKVYGSVAAMKRSKASRTKLADIVSNIHKEFHSTPDLNNEVTNIDDVISCDTLKKKSQSQEDILNAKNSRHSWACLSNSYGGSLEILDSKESDHTFYREAWKSIEDVYHGGASTGDASEIYAQTLPLSRSEKAQQRVSCPPPSHPPPPPPMGQVVKVDISKSLGEYANVNLMTDDPNSSIMSSFRPGDSAKLYASPEVVMSVGYKAEPGSVRQVAAQPRRTGGGSSLRSQSLPPKIPAGPIVNRSATSSETENSGDSSALYSSFKKPSRQRDSLSSDSGHVSDRGTLKSLKGKQSVTSAYASKFDIEDSDTGSPQNYPVVIAPGHEPFIPEPDYETSEEEDLVTSVDQGGVLSTFGKGEEATTAVKPPSPIKSQPEDEPEKRPPLSPHTEAKRAIQEARERLRFSHKATDKNATVVFISGKITERKVEKSEIQLHRTEEGRLTGTVVISTTNEPQEPLYLTSPVVNAAPKEACPVSRYPSRDAPASEYAKYRQQILSGMNRNLAMIAAPQKKDDGPPDKDDNTSSQTEPSKPAESDATPAETTVDHAKPEGGLRIALTGAQKPTRTSDSENTSKMATSDELAPDDAAENSSSGVSSDIETQSDHFAMVSSSTEEESKADTVVQSLPARQKPSLPVTEVPVKAVKISEELQAPKIPSREPYDKGIKKETTPKHVDSKPKEIRIDPRIVLGRPHEPKKSGTVNQKQSKSASERTVKVSNADRALEESLDVLRLQVNSLGVTEVNEVDVFAQLVPPPPEFAAPPPDSTESRRHTLVTDTAAIPIAPPPEFSDVLPPRDRRHTTGGRLLAASAPHRSSGSSKGVRLPGSPVDLALLASLCAKSGTEFCRIGKRTDRCTVQPSRTMSARSPRDAASNTMTQMKTVQKEFRFKLLQNWTPTDIADWLDSLFLSEYKHRFAEAGITGAKLANMDSNDLMGLGVKQMGHRLNMERSLKRYLR